MSSPRTQLSNIERGILDDVRLALSILGGVYATQFPSWLTLPLLKYALLKPRLLGSTVVLNEACRKRQQVEHAKAKGVRNRPKKLAVFHTT